MSYIVILPPQIHSTCRIRREGRAVCCECHPWRTCHACTRGFVPGAEKEQLPYNALHEVYEITSRLIMYKFALETTQNQHDES